MNITFKEFIAISEGKNVGIIYHFTRISSIENMVKFNFELGSRQDYISFTRNYDLVGKNYKNDFNKVLGDIRGARIAIDGSKLSNKYKLEPFSDIENTTRHSGEAEERYKGKSIDISCCILQIDYLNFKGSPQEKQIETELINSKFPEIKVNFVDKFKKVKQ